MKIAVIGSGISGLTSAYLLSKEHEVHVFEKEAFIGGHTATKDVEVDGEQYAIDTGFIVYNDWTYPNFILLLDELKVASDKTEMSFSVSANNKGYEYSGSSIDALFSQRKNIFSLKHWRMLKDILRFNKESISDLQGGHIDSGMTLGVYLLQKKYSQQFIDYYLIPMGCAIWSASTREMMDFPLYFFVQFFKNHGLLSVKNRPQWRVIRGGSSAYLEPLIKPFLNNIHCNSPIQAVKRATDSVTLLFADSSEEVFDQVIFSCHSDQALALLADASAAEQAILSSIAYQDNEVVLHTDESVLPKQKKAWASWNYHLEKDRQSQAVLSYNMNILQNIQSATTFCVTLNASDLIDPKKILGVYHYAHPSFTLEAIAAQARWQEINGWNNTWFCGAYWGNGFHEDGCASAVRVAQGLGVDW
jgi:predicted NAD/FAD-binding protein